MPKAGPDRIFVILSGPARKIYLNLFLSNLKILHAGLEDLHVLLPVNVHGNRLTAALGMGHLAQDAPVGAGDALDGQDVYKRQICLRRLMGRRW